MSELPHGPADARRCQLCFRDAAYAVYVEVRQRKMSCGSHLKRIVDLLALDSKPTADVKVRVLAMSRRAARKAASSDVRHA